MSTARRRLWRNSAASPRTPGTPAVTTISVSLAATAAAGAATRVVVPPPGQEPDRFPVRLDEPERPPPPPPLRPWRDPPPPSPRRRPPPPEPPRPPPPEPPPDPPRPPPPDPRPRPPPPEPPPELRSRSNRPRWCDCRPRWHPSLPATVSREDGDISAAAAGNASPASRVATSRAMASPPARRVAGHRDGSCVQALAGAEPAPCGEDVVDRGREGCSGARRYSGNSTRIPLARPSRAASSPSLPSDPNS